MKSTPSDPKTRNFLILSVSEINLIDFNEILETDSNTLRKSIDGTKIIIKWQDKKPKFINDIKSREGPYNYDEITAILGTSEWIRP